MTAIRDRLKTALSPLALWLAVILVGASAPGAAAAQAVNEADRDEPAVEAVVRTADEADRAEPAAGTVAQTGDEVEVAEAAKRTVPHRQDEVDVAEAAKRTVAHARDEADGAEPAPDAVVQVADWVIESGDNRGLPFAIIDKVGATLLVYSAEGQLKGAAPVLLGSARGDSSTPGVGDRELRGIPPKDRTTPAGRFLAAYGPAWGGKKVLWVDYATAVSLHPVITGTKKEQRAKRLKSPTPKDNRITFGCINVPVAFYQKVVRPAFSGTNGVVYILPETMPLGEALPAFQAHVDAGRVLHAGLDPQ